jgi:peptidoglycan/LPS O-acetylase OafA/YrhL
MLPPAFSKGFGEIHSSQTWYWLYMSNYSQSISEQAGHVTDHIAHVSWSLSIEEQFYLCWPLVVFLSGRKTLLKVCVGMFFGSMALRTFFLWQGNYNYSIGFTPCRLDGLAVGATIALIARGPGGLKSLVKPARWIGPIAAVSVTAIIISMQLIGYRRGIGQSPGYVMFGTALFGLLFGSVLVLAASAEKGTFFNRLFTHPVLKVYGKYSYAVYLLHLPIMVLISEYLFRPDRFRIGPTMLPGLLLFYALTWSLALLAGIISWHVLEKHFLKLKDYFPMEKKASTAAAWEGADVAVKG